MICALDFSDSDEGLHYIPCFGGRHGESSSRAHKQAKKAGFLGLVPKTVTRRQDCFGVFWCACFTWDLSIECLTRSNLLTEGVLDTVQLLDCVEQQLSKDCLQSEKKLFFKFRDCGEDAKRCHQSPSSGVLLPFLEYLTILFPGEIAAPFFLKSLFQVFFVPIPDPASGQTALPSSHVDERCCLGMGFWELPFQRFAK